MEVLFSALWAFPPSPSLSPPLSLVFMLVDCRISFRFTHQSTEVVVEAEKKEKWHQESVCVSQWQEILIGLLSEIKYK
jgi:hypothetical protein